MPLILLPRDFTTGDPIPSGWANNISDNFGGVDVRTGGDPGLVDFFLVAASGTTGVWRYLQARDYRAATIPDSAMANQKVNQVSPTTGGFAAVPLSGFYDIGATGDGPYASPNGWHLIQARHPNLAVDYRAQIAANHVNRDSLYFRTIVNGSPGPWRVLWSDANAGGTVPNPTTFAGAVAVNGATTLQGFATLNGDTTITRAFVNVPGQGILYLGVTAGNKVSVVGTGSGLQLNGDFVQAVPVLRANGGIQSAQDIQVYRSGTPTTGFFAFGSTSAHSLGYDGTNMVVDGSRIYRASDFTIGNAINNVPINNNQPNANLVAASAADAAQLGGRAPGGLPGQVPYNGGAGFLCQDLNAELLGGQPRSYYESLGSGGGTGTPIPGGLICLWNTATPPTGWVIETAFRERFPLSASVPGGTWPLGTNAGAANHTHATNIAHGHADTISVGGTVGAATGGTPEVNVVTPGTKTAADTHAHGFSGTKGGGVTALGSSPVTSDPTAHMPPFYAIHYIRKS